ncbi:Lrp/AsnC family transcriptional regulator [Mycolicibacterium sp.]|uniref:Lrp/AsnC family transcriptional regulator n=1 Tax=Mycolicibacterium sp. TaxID=2320850 RepID=UPI001A19C1A0|nr:Lrp/AsnC family transcriptional regulator [Mycolicibacterium sp.]MBJ7400151.1 Lrp/AsnC family transcriptional regulator [Mycolicibacterium sp.]
MAEQKSKKSLSQVAEPKDIRAADLDEIDRRLLTLLHADARTSNSALADAVGIAPSTCHGRVRRLQDLGVIRGFHAEIDPAAIGLPLQAMVSVSLQSGSRGKIRSFVQQIRRKPQVIDVYFLAGADDFLIHVAARDTDDLRSFVVDNLNADSDVAGTQTSLIFEHLRGGAPL